MSKKQIHVDLPEHLHAALRERAEYEHRSLGAETRFALARHLIPNREGKSKAVERPEAVTSD
jgi:plasmid stability protein